MITRIAPTPSGFLHAGNGLSFLLTYALARAQGGSILLRIDDLDAERMRLDYVEDIFRTLDWLGISWDSGPTGVADFQKNWSQHRRIDLYNDALQKLSDDTVHRIPFGEGGQNGILYACTCSRKQIQDHVVNGLYPQTCREKRLPFDATGTAWRLKVSDSDRVSFIDYAFDRQEFTLSSTSPKLYLGDFIVRQKNGLPAYQLASLVDDVHFGITTVVRGVDLKDSTAAQILLADKLNYDSFLKTNFYHHPLLTDTLGQKLSKSKGSSALADWQMQGKSSEILVRQVGKWFSQETEIQNLAELIDFLKQPNSKNHTSLT